MIKFVIFVLNRVYNWAWSRRNKNKGGAQYNSVVYHVGNAITALELLKARNEKSDKQKLKEVTDIVMDMRNLADKGAFVKNYPYEITDHLWNALCLEDKDER